MSAQPPILAVPTSSGDPVVEADFGDGFPAIRFGQHILFFYNWESWDAFAAQVDAVGAQRKLDAREA